MMKFTFYGLSNLFRPRDCSKTRRSIEQLRCLSTKSKNYKIELSPSQFKYFNCPELDLVVETTREELLEGYRLMNLIRRFETVCDELYKKREIRGFCHLSIGQEAVSAGLKLGSKENDSFITSYRCHGLALSFGVTVEGALAELCGRKTGCSKGKGGSMHIFSDTFYGGHGIVGAQVPLGAGISLANKHLHPDRATFVLYGDGAANQGQVYETFNMAKLWNLPVVFICENNIYGMGTPVSRSSATPDFFNKCTYIPGLRVDAMNFIAVKHATKFVRDWILSGKGPIIMEALTYRYQGHSMSDPGVSYRTKDEIQHYRKTNDSINCSKSYILELGAGTEEELAKIVSDVREEIDEVKNKVLATPMPDEHELETDIYSSKSQNQRFTAPSWIE